MDETTAAKAAANAVDWASAAEHAQRDEIRTSFAAIAQAWAMTSLALAQIEPVVDPDELRAQIAAQVEIDQASALAKITMVEPILQEVLEKKSPPFRAIEAAMRIIRSD